MVNGLYDTRFCCFAFNENLWRKLKPAVNMAYGLRCLTSHGRCRLFFPGFREKKGEKYEKQTEGEKQFFFRNIDDDKIKENLAKIKQKVGCCFGSRFFVKSWAYVLYIFILLFPLEFTAHTEPSASDWFRGGKKKTAKQNAGRARSCLDCCICFLDNEHMRVLLNCSMMHLYTHVLVYG